MRLRSDVRMSGMPCKGVQTLDLLSTAGKGKQEVGWVAGRGTDERRCYMRTAPWRCDSGVGVPTPLFPCPCDTREELPFFFVSSRK